MSLDVAPTAKPLDCLVLAPTGGDADALVQTLGTADIVAESCPSMGELCRRMEIGAGAAIVAVEALVEQGPDALERTLQRQPRWSDFPVIVMDAAQRGTSSTQMLVRQTSLSYAVVLVRPVYAHTLVSTVRAALRSRLRQYQVRDELAERKRAEHALRESNERKDDFMAMLGHELRNPLAAIRSATDLMKVIELGNPRLQRAQRVLDRQSLHMTRLIDGLLEVSRLGRGKIHLDLEPLDIAMLLQTLLDDRAGHAKENGLELRWNHPSEPLWVAGDQVRLVQVFDNLLSNAIKFTVGPGTIGVTLDQEGEAAVIRIRDTGVGIRPEMIDRLFEPFQQERQDMARTAGGLGLGLALARGLVELHGGTIAARSEGRGHGAEFVVRLPLTLAPDLDLPAARGQGVRARRVLVVEDNQDARETMRDLLEVLGHEVEVAENGDDALARLRRRPVDLVLCDLGLPGMSGYDVAGAIRGDPSLQGLTLVAVTGYGQPEDRKRTARAGFDEHLTKPVEAEALQAVLAQLGDEGR